MVCFSYQYHRLRPALLLRWRRPSVVPLRSRVRSIGSLSPRIKINLNQRVLRSPAERASRNMRFAAFFSRIGARPKARSASRGTAEIAVRRNASKTVQLSCFFTKMSVFGRRCAEFWPNERTTVSVAIALTLFRIYNRLHSHRLCRIFLFYTFSAPKAVEMLRSCLVPSMCSH